MAYDPTIPTKTASPATSYTPIQENYLTAYNALAVNHSTFAEPFEGNHIKIFLQKQTDDPTVSAKSITIFNKAYSHDSPTVTANELFLKRTGDTATAIPFTAYGTTHNVNGTTTSDITWFYLMTGELVKCGTSTWAGGAGSALVPLNLAGQPTFTSADSLRATASMNTSAGFVTIVELKPAGISFSVSSSGQVNWCVIGV